MRIVVSVDWHGYEDVSGDWAVDVVVFMGPEVYQVRMRIGLPLASHLELFDVELGLVVVVDLQCRPIAYFQTGQGKVMAHL
jgi:hypothetical protein